MLQIIPLNNLKKRRFHIFMYNIRTYLKSHEKRQKNKQSSARQQIFQ